MIWYSPTKFSTKLLGTNFDSNDWDKMNFDNQRKLYLWNKIKLSLRNPHQYIYNTEIHNQAYDVINAKCLKKERQKYI